METLPRNEPMFISVPHAAILLGVSAPTVRRWIRLGHIRATQPAGHEGALLVPLAELERLAGGSRG